MPLFLATLPGWIYLIGIELAVLLVALCLYLLLHVRGLRDLIAALEARVMGLRDTLRGARREAQSAREALAEARRQRRDYLDFIDEQIDATRDHHQTLDPGCDIELDLAPDAPPERQALALRHSLLTAEKEAWLAGDAAGCDWAVLGTRLGEIIALYQQPAADDIDVDGIDIVAMAEADAADFTDPQEREQLLQSVANLRRQVANLERFRTLYFAGEQQWQESSRRADACHDELLALGERLGGGDDYRALLQKYRDIYGEFDAHLSEQATSVRGDLERGAQPAVGRMVIANQEEVQRLRNMAVDQHKVILQLKRQLQEAATVEEKDAVIVALHQQLERQERFLQESDTCTRLLEDELQRALQENHQLKEQSPAADVGLEQLVADLTRESRDMLAAIGVMEAENRRLRERPPADADNLRQKLSEAQQALLGLQTRHLELEERYLALKAPGEQGG